MHQVLKVPIGMICSVGICTSVSRYRCSFVRNLFNFSGDVESITAALRRSETERLETEGQLLKCKNENGEILSLLKSDIMYGVCLHQ